MEIGFFFFENFFIHFFLQLCDSLLWPMNLWIFHAFLPFEKRESEFQFLFTFFLRNEMENDDFFHRAKQRIHPSICWREQFSSDFCSIRKSFAFHPLSIQIRRLSNCPIIRVRWHSIKNKVTKMQENKFFHYLGNRDQISL